ncbi:acetyl-CoA carboxylase biotin carboxyl carrier protein [Lyngbya aestuarii]|uniref:acetyl-CoA carboxylase biotin carboxyl carrier protein n=1 Tax=Lyngbya aestuarii TaxID=118322 RepID=UPI00403DDA69
MSLDFNQLRELLAAIAQTDITELNLKSADFELMVRQGISTAHPIDSSLISASAVPSSGSGVSSTPEASSSPATTAEIAIRETITAPSVAAPSAIDSKWEAVDSPMVGTFYRSPAPDEAPYVEVGDHVRVGQTICIIEAMKLMNEIEAEASGQVMEILVKNGDPVEYKQPLMRIKPE